MGKADQCAHRAFPARLEALEPMMDWVRKRSCEAGFSGSDLKKIELALEEALVNIIHHSSLPEADVIDVSSHIPKPGVIHFTIKDKGKPFNPLLQFKEIDRNVKLEDRREGGIGIFLIFQYMDQVHYERSHPYNVLTLTKRSKES